MSGTPTHAIHLKTRHPHSQLKPIRAKPTHPSLYTHITVPTKTTYQSPHPLTHITYTPDTLNPASHTHESWGESLGVSRREEARETRAEDWLLSLWASRSSLRYSSPFPKGSGVTRSGLPGWFDRSTHDSEEQAEVVISLATWFVDWW